jgi:hypothetical protein
MYRCVVELSACVLCTPENVTAPPPAPWLWWHTEQEAIGPLPHAAEGPVPWQYVEEHVFPELS